MSVHFIWMQEFFPPLVHQQLQNQKKFFKPLGITMELWNESRIVDFISKQYPQYILKYIRVLNTIQRCDLARAFILHAFGGVYMDIDYRPLEAYSQFFSPGWNEREEVVVGENELLGVNNAWVYSSKGHSFWTKFLHQCFQEIENPSFQNICIKLFVPTWEVISSTGPAQYYSLKEFLRIEPRVYREWGKHGEDSEPTWFNKSANVQQTLVVSLLLIGCIGFFCTRGMDSPWNEYEFEF
jgi:mannosyltransferase OCH1-like enzyme